MITQIRHTGLVVYDMERALEFWRDLLGFTVRRRMEESGPYIDALLGLKDVHVTTVKLAAPDGNLIELLHFESHPDRSTWAGSPNSTGFTHVALTVDNLEKECARLARAGVKFNSAPQIAPDGSAKVTFVRGPEGTLVELVEML